MRPWLIVYKDGSTHSSEDGPPWTAPVGGVEVVYHLDSEVGLQIEQSRHGYWGWRDDYGWVGFRTQSGYWDYMFTRGHMKYVLYGRTMRDPEYAELLKEAGELATGWAKSAWAQTERMRDVPDEP